VSEAGGNIVVSWKKCMSYVMI